MNFAFLLCIIHVYSQILSYMNISLLIKLYLYAFTNTSHLYEPSIIKISNNYSFSDQVARFNIHVYLISNFITICRLKVIC